MVGSVRCISCNAPAIFSSSVEFSAFTATVYNSLGILSPGNASSPIFGSIRESPVFISLSLMAMAISPAITLSTFSRFLPFRTNSCDRRSLCPLRGQIKSALSVSVPPKSLKKETSPRCCSIDVLKTNIATGSWALELNSLPFFVFTAGIASGEGQELTIKSSKRDVPTPCLADEHITGNIVLVTNPFRIPSRISSSVRVSFSKYFSIKASSPSAALSTNARCSSSALSFSEAGMSLTTGSPPLGLKVSCFIKIRSITVLKPSPPFTGY